MRIQRLVSLTLLLTLGATTAWAQAAASFGPRKIYLRGQALAWQLPVPSAMGELFDLAVAAGEAQGMVVSERDDEEGMLRLLKTELTGAELDELCRYPILGYYKWRPVENFAQAQARAMRERVRGESTAEAALSRGNVHLSIRLADGVYTIQSICSAYLRDWGLLETSSKGVLEKAFLEELTAALGMPTEVQLPGPGLEPSREDPTRDLQEARRCLENCRPGRPCPGVYVHPETRQLLCVEEPPS